MNCSTGNTSRHNLTLISMLTLFITLLVFSYGIISIPSAEAKYVFSNKWGTIGTGNGQFNAPEGIAVDTSGLAYVADTGNNRIQQFRLATPCPGGTTQIVGGVCFVRAWGALGSGTGQFNKPSDVALDSAGRVYVADKGNDRIQMFRGNGAFMQAWNSDGPGTAQFINIVGVAVDTSNNQIYAAEYMIDGQGVVHKFQLASPCPVGTTEVVPGICFIDKWTYGRPPHPPDGPPDPLNSVRGLAVNGLTHDVFVSNYKDIQMPGNELFDEYYIVMSGGNGTLLDNWGGRVSSDIGRFSYPTGIGVGPSGLVYVADSQNYRIQVFRLANPCPDFNPQLKPGVCFVTRWGTLGSANGQFAVPTDVAIGGPLGHVYVADTYNYRIQEFFWKPDIRIPNGGGGTPPSIASSLTMAEKIKIESQLAQKDLASNDTTAKEHAQHSIELLKTNDTKEINERNPRLATELNNTLSDFVKTFESGKPSESIVKDKVSKLGNVLSEVVNARIDKQQLDNVTIKVQVAKDLVAETLQNYKKSLGMSEASQDKNNTSSSNSNETKIVDEADYESAQADISRAIELYNEITSGGNAKSIELLNALISLKDKIENKSPYDQADKVVEYEITPIIEMGGAIYNHGKLSP